MVVGGGVKNIFYKDGQDSVPGRGEGPGKSRGYKEEGLGFGSSRRSYPPRR